MRLGRHGNRHRIDAAGQLARIKERRRVMRRGDLSRAGLIDVDDGHDLDAWQRRQNPRVMFPEMPDPDDGNA